MSNVAKSTPAIRASAIAKHYVSSKRARVTGLSPTSLSIEEGAFVSIVGRSGCGKSTLLRLIAGLETASGGYIEIAGAKVTAPPPSVRYVFQDYGQSLLPWKTVGDNIRFGLQHAYRLPAGEEDRKTWGVLVEERLAEVGLGGLSDRYPAELSGGMQQRVAIARALASRPNVLLLDEPFSAVDALSKTMLQDLILRIWNAHKLTVLMVTHDIEEAIYLSDRLVVLGPEGQGVLTDGAVGLARPRDQLRTRSGQDYLTLRNEVLGSVLGLNRTVSSRIRAPL